MTSNTNGVAAHLMLLNVGHPDINILTKFKHIPVKDIVICESLSVKQRTKELTQMAIIGSLFESKSSAVLQV